MFFLYTVRSGVYRCRGRLFFFIPYLTSPAPCCPLFLFRFRRCKQPDFYDVMDLRTTPSSLALEGFGSNSRARSGSDAGSGYGSFGDEHPNAPEPPPGVNNNESSQNAPASRRRRRDSPPQAVSRRIGDKINPKYFIVKFLFVNTAN